MITTPPVPGLTQDHAKRAAQVAAGLSDAGVYLLILMYHIDKSDAARIFQESEVCDRPSFGLPLRPEGLTVESVLRELYEKGMIEPFGRHRFRATPPGCIVKHRFYALWTHFKVYGRVPTSGLDLQTVRVLRSSMESLALSGKA